MTTLAFKRWPRPPRPTPDRYAADPRRTDPTCPCRIMPLIEDDINDEALDSPQERWQ